MHVCTYVMCVSVMCDVCRLARSQMELASSRTLADAGLKTAVRDKLREINMDKVRQLLK